MQLTVEGKTAANETVLVNPTFAVVQGAGDVAPKAPTASMSSTFRAGSTPGTATVTDMLADPSLPAITATARVDVASLPVANSFWLLSEANSLSVTPDVNALIVVFQGGTATPPILEDSIDNPCEGGVSLRATVNNLAEDAYSGWSYQCGLAGSSDTETYDMSQFYGASMRFCFKAQGGLADKMQVGVRSGNVPTATELSYVVLTNGGLFDSAWHEVVVPVESLAGPRPWADLARVKNFFTITVVGATVGHSPSVWTNCAGNQRCRSHSRELGASQTVISTSP